VTEQALTAFWRGSILFFLISKSCRSVSVQFHNSTGNHYVLRTQVVLGSNMAVSDILNRRVKTLPEEDEEFEESSGSDNSDGNESGSGSDAESAEGSEDGSEAGSDEMVSSYYSSRHSLWTSTKIFR
jgi:hypothetical protein